MRIRSFRDADADSIINLFKQFMVEITPVHQETVFDQYVARAIAEELSTIAEYYSEAAGNKFFVAEKNSAIVGCVGLEREDQFKVKLRRMLVAKDCRRKGIATVLLEVAESHSKTLGYEHIVLSTSDLQKPAMKFYKERGFVVVKEETARGQTNQTVGNGITRFHFTKSIQSVAHFNNEQPARDGYEGQV